jgi:hypothetical protein
VTRRRDDELDALSAEWPDDERALLARLRALPDEGGEPDWAALERDIGRAVDAEAARPRSWAWLTRWWRPALGLGLVAAAAAIVIVARREPAPAPPQARSAIDAGVVAPVAEREPPAPRDDRPLVLGAEGELDPDELDDELLDGVLAELDPEAWTDPSPRPQPEDGLVPDLGLDWVDELDDDELEAVDQWLAVLDEGT